MRSTRTTRPLKPLALAVTFAALAVPTAHGDIPPAVKYGPLDPSAYNLVHKSTQSDIPPAVKYGPLDPWAYSLVHKSTQSVPLITEHSAGQNGASQLTATGKYGPLDPAIAGANGGQSAAQNGVLRSAAASLSASASNGFKWRDAGIGAGVAFAAILLAVGVATLILRRGRRRLAGF